MNRLEYRLKELTEEIHFYTKYEEQSQEKVPQLKQLLEERKNILNELNR